MESTGKQQHNKHDFDFSNVPAHWLNQHPFLTHMFNAPSLVAPQLEGLVTHIVKIALPFVTDDILKNECNRFLQDEMNHAHQHVRYNQLLKQQGYEVAGVSQHVTHALNEIKTKWSLLSVLALGVGIECFTAIISEVVLTQQTLTQAHPALRDFWTWHMREELQHKSVLYDLYQHLGGGYFRRVSIFAFIIFYYCTYGFKIYFALINTDKLSKKSAFLCAVGRKSFFIKSLLKCFRVFKTAFHPDRMDHSHLLALHSNRGGEE